MIDFGSGSVMRSAFFAAILAAFASVPAIAQVAQPGTTSYVFGSSNPGSAGSPAWILTLDGNRQYASTDTGWIDSLGFHQSYNSNYIAASNLNGLNYNNYAVFDLGSLNVPVTSAALTIQTFDVYGSDVAFRLFDVSSAPGLLDRTRDAGDVEGQRLYADLGSGRAYGDRHYGPADDYTTRTLALTPAALTDLSRGGVFAVGGSVAAAVPEASTWAMMIMGLGGTGVVLRSRRRRRGAQSLLTTYHQCRDPLPCRSVSESTRPNSPKPVTA